MSPELKTIVYSKRSDPRMGDQTFALTNIVRSEPDPSLFMVPSDFKLIDTPGPIMYKTAGYPPVAAFGSALEHGARIHAGGDSGDVR